ncbi:O-methyltransferase [Alicyclobacillus ferrooxydans]|uniref:Uncharacterized protein n=1 Tax=Alicyclobacillus ferrooxydans TaxID=471514 RepID=A0A0P9CCF5_9BACL|nr:class I SAM-dependent methyltransferase [Alicyclobacillus ferrooxydans]KPV43188.1 hypothetical protein AN477_13970 [Alicyclobacillus ferrooxydans]
MQRPSLVDPAMKLAESLGFENSCLDEFGQLLHLLAGHIQSGKVAEIGTGCGVSTAWIASATSLDVYTVDNDEERAIETRKLFVEHPNVHQIVGDWERILHEGPFRLVFVDAKPAKLEGIDKVVNATEVGGLIVIDDLTPVEFWTEEWKRKPDLVRDAWLHHNQLASIEVRTSLKASAILARRIC